MSDVQTSAPAWARNLYHTGGPWAGLRQEAFERFLELGLPTPRNEAWKYTNVAPIARGNFKAAGEGRLSGADVERLLVPGLSARPIVFINGQFRADLSSVDALPQGVMVSSLGALRAGTAPKELVVATDEHLGRHARFKDEAFTALNTACLTDGAVIVAERGIVVDQPFHVVFVTTADQAEAVTHPRLLIVARENSELTVLESYIGLGANQYFTDAVTELVVESGAVVDHCRLEEEGPGGFHVGAFHINQGRASRVQTGTFSFGGALVRNNLEVVLDGEGVSSTLLGLSVLEGAQHVDNFTVLDHARPHCESRELYKGIYDDRSRGVFNGTIIVREGAQKTNAIQSNRSLLLTAEAAVDTKPQLKIWADDVKCTHGATVGQLDDDALFYIRSRGVGEAAARNMLIHAFASEVVSELKRVQLRHYLEERLLRKLGEQV